MIYKTTTFVSAGSSPVNEDNLAYSQWENGGIWAAAEGYGDEGRGEHASDKAVSEAIETFTAGGKLTQKSVEQGIKAISSAVGEGGGAASLGCLWIVEDRIRFFTVGNVMILRFRDHMVSEKSLNGKGSSAGIRNRKNLLGNHPELFVSKEISAEPGDAFVICTDGLWKNMNDLEMTFDRLKSKNEAEWVNAMVKRAFMKTGPREYKDSVSVIVVKII